MLDRVVNTSAKCERAVSLSPHSARAYSNLVAGGPLCGASARYFASACAYFCFVLPACCSSNHRAVPGRAPGLKPPQIQQAVCIDTRKK